MKRPICAAYVLAAVLSLSACEYYKLEEIHRVEPTGTPFQKALANNYRALSMAEQQLYDWQNAVVYASKSLEAAYGHEVAPEELQHWDIPAELTPPMEQAREALTAMLAGDAKEVKPQRAADAQTFFDCWVEQQDEGWQLEDIAYCRNQFEEAMKELTGAALPRAAKKAAEKVAKKEEQVLAAAPEPTAAPEPAAVPEPAAAPAAAEPTAPPPPKPETPPMETASYIVFFNADAALLNEMGQKIVDNASESLKSHATYQVVINSHTDTYGGAKNPELPLQRAQAVKERLIQQGIEESAITVLARGETKSAGDVLFNPPPVERKIEIFISE